MSKGTKDLTIEIFLAFFLLSMFSLVAEYAGEAVTEYTEICERKHVEYNLR